MRKQIALLLAILMLVICCACKGNTAEKPAGNTSSQIESSSDSTGSESDVDDNVSEEENTGDVDSSKDDEDSSDDEDNNDDDTSSENKDNDSSDDKKEADTTSKENITVGKLEIGDSAIFESFILVDDSINYPDTFVEYKTAPSTLDTPWNKDVSKSKGNSDELADEMRKNILNTKNTLENNTVTGTIYYVSPNGSDDNDGKTPETALQTTQADIFTMRTLKPGDAVLFERGGLWRLTSAIKCRPGVTYGSYGEGEKPTFYGSPYNFANGDYWTPSNRQNIWKITIADSDIGLVVMNNGEMVGVKKLNGIIALEKNGDYYFNQKQDTLYLYCDKGNPGKVYEDIELGLNKALFSISRTDNVTIDNIRMKYSGRFGVDIGTSDYTVVTNCEIGFIGGAIHHDSVRLGNGIQAWDGAVGHRVENCWLYQIYDAALTWQGDERYGYDDSKAQDDNYKEMTYKDITYKDNLIEYSTYSFEFWHGNDNVDTSATKAFVENFVCTNNISRFAGFGWGRQRDDHTGNHICVFERSFPNAKGNKITDNIFDLADSYVVKWGFRTGADNGEWDISNNTYYHGFNKFNDAMRFGSQVTATDLNSLKSAIAIFESNPKAVIWVED